VSGRSLAQEFLQGRSAANFNINPIFSQLAFS